MKKIRIRRFVVILLATACGHNPVGSPPPPPPPPPPPSAGPVVAVSAKTSVPTGAPYAVSATFSDTTGSASPWSYSIAWGDGNTSTGSKSTISAITESHVYAAEGSYHAAITVTNEKGGAGSDSFALTATAPVILTAGDIADCTRPADDSTAALLDTLQGIVMPLGDNAYTSGTAQQYAQCYDPTWVRQKARTKPVAGNHDYYDTTSAGVGASGYFGYFGAAAGDPTKGYYDFTLGSWLVIVLNTGTDVPSNYAAGSPQEQWLRGELASHNEQCVLAMWHHPRFSTIAGRDSISYYTAAIWDALYQYGADLVLNGHDHAYQRFALQRPDGTRDNTFGIRQIAVGTGGGETLYQFATPAPAGSNIEVRNNTTHGILQVTLRANGYDWKFVPSSGATFTDSGSGTCHGRPS